MSLEPAEAPTIVRFGREIAAGLAAMHARGLVHRDIKPNNLWLDAASGHIKILDFGLARDLRRDKPLTEPGVLIGTPCYLAPEQAKAGRIDARADLFSLGCVLYRLCTGRVPFPGETVVEQLAALASGRPIPVDTLNPAIPAALAELVMWLLAKDPADRPQSVEVVAHRLHDIKVALGNGEAGHDPTQPVTPTSGRRQHFLKRHWKRLVGATAFLVLAVFAIIGICHLTDGSDGPTDDGKTYLQGMKKVHTVNWPFHGKGPKGPKAPPPELFDPISVQGRPSPHGLFMHPAPPFLEAASVSYPLNRQYQTFAAEVSLNDSSPEAPSALTFAVYGDGKLLWRSKGIVSQAEGQRCVVPVNDVNILKLEVTAESDVRRAHAVWIEPCVWK